eukprot:Lithocolla_globosa_v1_NODE_84_length_6699_cov_54.834938.p9 type:complete len:106 gc:universal NODE_84_length_6699_cov_54.834938:1335-1018(-)
MVIIGVAKPVLLQGWTNEDTKWLKDGKVFLERVRRLNPLIMGRRKKIKMEMYAMALLDLEEAKANLCTNIERVILSLWICSHSEPPVWMGNCMQICGVEKANKRG